MGEIGKVGKVGKVGKLRRITLAISVTIWCELFVSSSLMFKRHSQKINFNSKSQE